MNLTPAPVAPWRASIAPMMGYTDRHFRFLMRLLSKHVRLYTEMLTPGAILHGDRTRFLAYDPSEHPIALQLGGCDPITLTACAKIAEDWGFDEVNLNAGCPSDRVQQGRFGACLMAEPERVAECVAQMRDAVRIPITIKTRIGIDDTSDDFLKNFVAINRSAGCEVFIIHARKAWLKGLNPKENREIPPLCYARVTQLQQDFPDLTIVLNGGITDIHTVPMHLNHVKGVMIGRSAYQSPYQWHALDAMCFGEAGAQKSRGTLVLEYCEYMAAQMKNNATPLRAMTRHLLPLFNGLPGANRWRRALSENVQQSAGVTLVTNALNDLLMLAEVVS